MRILLLVLAVLVPAPGCAPAQPESCVQLEAAATADAAASCAIAPTCAAGGSSYTTQEGATLCAAQCQAILDNGGCGEPAP